jgi:hypothetical protein
VTGRSYGIGTDEDYATIKYYPCVVGCRSGYIITSPTEWADPPLKVAPNGTRELSLKLYNLGDRTCTGDASGDLICVQGSYPIWLCPKCTTSALTFTVSGAGACNNTFICGYVTVTTDEGGGKCDTIPVRAVVANDYYECPNDPQTVDTLDNGVLRIYANANGEEWIHDIGSFRGDEHQVFFEGSNIVATTSATDTIVGRFYSSNIIVKDSRAGVRDKLYTVECDVDWEPDFWLVYTKDIYIMTPVPACTLIDSMNWYWWEESKQIKLFKPTAPDIYKHLVIEYVRVKRHNPPTWWPNQTSLGPYPNTYIGVASDINAPADENANNEAGYDDVNHIAWQKGSGSYSSYYCGIALANGGRPGESTVPYGAYNVRNDMYLYPQNGWGWRDSELYRLAADPLPADIQDEGLALDRSQVFTARMIPAGNDPNADYSYTVVKVVAPGGLTQLQQCVDTARAIVDREKSHGIPVICADVNCDGNVGLGDLVYFTTYQYKGGPAPCCPIWRADVTGDGIIGLGDVVYFTTYQYKGGPKPNCRGFYAP